MNGNLIRKFDAIKSNVINTLIPGHKDWFVNKSQFTIPTGVELFLSLGPKFGLPISEKETPIFDLIADTENILQNGKNDEIKDIVRSKISNAILNHRKFHIPSPIQRLLLKSKLETKIFLRNHKEIVILPADKGNITVAMNKTDLERKTYALLNDATTYIKCKDPTSTTLTSVKNIVNDMVESGYITKEKGKQLYTNSPSPPKLYCLPKVHKEGTPVRPIVSWCNSPCHALSQFLAKILHRSHVGSYNIKNSYELQREITNVVLEENEILVSYDVKSLFTNVPIYLVLCIINEQWGRIEQYTSLPKKMFMKCMRICCISSNYFVYKNEFFRQTFGCPMGSPLAPIMADLIMTQLLDVSIPRLSYVPKFMYKYVDDLVSIVPFDKIEETLDILNSFHDRINFTHEIEQDRCLAYLDIQLIRNDQKIETKAYIKPTSKLRMLHWQSFHPTFQKRNIIKGTINRLLTITSPTYKTDAENLIIAILIKNGYPVPTIKSELQRFKSRITDTPIVDLHQPNNSTVATSHQIPPEMENSEKNILYSSIIYVSNLSEKIVHIIKKHSGDEIMLRIAFKMKSTIKNECFTKLKDTTEKRKLNDVVYQISCSCGSKYVGQTSNYLITRMYGHNSDIKSAIQLSSQQKEGEIIGENSQLIIPNHHTIAIPSSPTPPNILKRNKDKSAIYYHALESNHRPDVYDMDNIEILCKESNLYKRLIKEMLYIQNTPNAMNKRSEIDCLSRIFCRLL